MVGISAPRPGCGWRSRGESRAGSVFRQPQREEREGQAEGPEERRPDASTFDEHEVGGHHENQVALRVDFDALEQEDEVRRNRET
jgi:hypothetical protein